jgi:phospholipase C
MAISVPEGKEVPMSGQPTLPTMPVRVRHSRRAFLKGSLAAGASGGGFWTTALHPARGWAADTPIEHIIVSCQENRSFDHYFGFAPQVQAAGFGPPPLGARQKRQGCTRQK